MASIRRRLLGQLLLALGLVWSTVAAITYHRAYGEIEDVYDGQLSQTASVLKEVMLVDPEWSAYVLGDQRDPARYRHKYEKRLSFQLWREGHLIARSFGAPDFPLADRHGFSDQTIKDTRWRVFGLRSKDASEVLFVGESYEIREELVRYITRDALLPLLVSMPILAFLIWYAIGRGLQPIHRVARAVAQRSPDQLDPVDIDTVPNEIRPLAAALNRLFECLQKALAKERRFTSDAAHEMRTPLAIIKTHAQIAARAAHPAEKDRAIRYVIEGVDRSSHLVLQMLTLARLDPDNPSLRLSPCSLVDVAAAVQRELHPMQSAKHIRLELKADPRTRVMGYAPGLGVLLRNLLDNAIRYTPAGGRVLVETREEGEHCLLEVVDTGPGIAQEERERIFERFYRPAGQRQPGAGLGLSIVAEICRLHQAAITLGTGPGGQGLSVSVRLQRAAEPERGFTPLPELSRQSA